MGRHVVGKLERREVGGKAVYIAESHHMVLEAWAELRQKMSMPPHLVTLDFHTDLLGCFTEDAGKADPYDAPSLEAITAHSKPLIARLATLAPSEVRAMIHLLTFQEHIDAAQHAGIIDHVFLGQSEEAANNLKTGEHQHIISKNTDEKTEADTVLEPAFLGMLVGKVEMTVGQPLEAVPYILDVDLDFFRTAKAILPDDPSVLHQLIQNATIITVALEPGCVESGRLPGETITSESLLADLVEQIVVARGTPSEA